MTDNSFYQASLRRRSVSESDNDLLSSMINPTGNVHYPANNRAESNPNLSISCFIDESPFAGPGTRLQSRREGTESGTNKISIILENLRSEVCTWVDRIKIQSCPNDEFQTQFIVFSNRVNELTMLALMNRVSTTTSRDISELSSIILKCKRDRVKNPLLRNDRTALRTESCVPNITPITVDSINAGIGRGNMRSEGASL